MAARYQRPDPVCVTTEEGRGEEGVRGEERREAAVRMQNISIN